MRKHIPHSLSGAFSIVATQCFTFQSLGLRLIRVCAIPYQMSSDVLTPWLPYLDGSFPNAQIVNAIFTCCGPSLVSTNTHGRSVSGK